MPIIYQSSHRYVRTYVRYYCVVGLYTLVFKIKTMPEQKIYFTDQDYVEIKKLKQKGVLGSAVAEMLHDYLIKYAKEEMSRSDSANLNNITISTHEDIEKYIESKQFIGLNAKVVREGLKKKLLLFKSVVVDTTLNKIVAVTSLDTPPQP